MEEEITGVPNEIPIVYVLITLGFLSFLATFIVIDLKDASSNTIMAAGFICGICALPLGFKMADTGSVDSRTQAHCHC